MKKLFTSALLLFLVSCAPVNTNQNNQNAATTANTNIASTVEKIYTDIDHNFSLILPNTWTWEENTSGSGSRIVNFYSASTKDKVYSLSVQKDTSTEEDKFLDTGSTTFILSGAYAWLTNVEDTQNNYKEELRIRHNGNIIVFTNTERESTNFPALYSSFNTLEKTTAAYSDCNVPGHFSQEAWHNDLLARLAQEPILSDEAMTKMLKENPSLGKEGILKLYGKITPDWIRTICISPDNKSLFIIAGTDYMVRGKLFKFTPETNTLQQVKDSETTSHESWNRILIINEDSIQIESAFGDGPGGMSTLYTLSLEDLTLTKKGECSYGAIFDKKTEEMTGQMKTTCTIDGKSFTKIR
ncbi:MAG: hypothetical protein ACK4NC_06810 [Candidatus Gracilibacteria bacterium]